MVIVNLTHPLTPEQLEQVEALAGQAATRIVGLMAQFDHARPLDAQVEALLDQVGLSAEEWQTLPIVVNLPGFAPAAACVVAQLHGRTGYFPAVLRLRPLEGSTPTRFAVAEIVNLQAARDAARLKRQGGEEQPQ